MTLEGFVSSLNDEQLKFLFNHSNGDFQDLNELLDCVEFAMELRGLL